MIVTVFVRRLKEGRTFEEFVAEWQADVGFGVPTRVFNAVSLEDPRDVISIGFVAVTVPELQDWLARDSSSEQRRHEQVATVIESTTLRCMYEVRTEHDFTGDRCPSMLVQCKACCTPLRSDPIGESRLESFPIANVMRFPSARQSTLTASPSALVIWQSTVPSGLTVND